MRSISDLFEETSTRRATDSLGGIFFESMVLLVHSSSLSNPFIQPSREFDTLLSPEITREEGKCQRGLELTSRSLFSVPCLQFEPTTSPVLVQAEFKPPPLPQLPLLPSIPLVSPSTLPSSVHRPQQNYHLPSPDLFQPSSLDSRRLS